MSESKYQNGKIYKITDVGYNKCYIGSTVQSLSNRMSEHRKRYLIWRQGLPTNYTSSFQLFDEYGLENCKIELIELCPCNSKDELHKKEGEHIKNNDCVNKIISGRSRKEWYSDNLEVLKEKWKAYAETNKEKIKEYKKQYQVNNKERLKDERAKKYQANRDEVLAKCKIYRETHKEEKHERDHKYYEEHREKRLSYAEDYRNNNKDLINSKRREKITCDVCGVFYNKGDKARHERSKKHQEKLKDPNEI